MEKEITETTPLKVKEEITVPVKYNKETVELPLERAAELAQKGLKFEAIEDDYLALKKLASKENKSVPAFIKELAAQRHSALKQELLEKCGGNEEMAEKLLKLEDPEGSASSLEEIYAAFENIKSPDDLPDEVLQRVSLKGTNALNEYLRYLLSQKTKSHQALKKQKENLNSSTGSLINLKSGSNPETEEFLRGLWR